MHRVAVVLASLAVFAVTAALAQEKGDAGRGRAFAEKNCSQCHEIRAGHYDSPVMDVPPFEDVANARDMSEIALFPFFQTSHVSMPNFVIAPDDIRDVTAYILTLRDR